MTAEPPIPFPASPYCQVRARVASIWADGPDDGTHPDWRPAAGERVTLTPSIGSQLLTYDVGGPEPIIVTVERVECVVDESGWLAKFDGRPVFIAPTDDPLLSATGWTWTATIRGKSITFAAPSGGVVDLAMFIAAPATDNTKAWVERIPELIDAAGDLVSIESVTRDGDDLVVAMTNGSVARFPLSGDAAVESLIDNPASLTRGAVEGVSDTIATTVANRHKHAVAPRRAAMPGIFTLLGGTPDENLIISNQQSQFDTCQRVTLDDGTRAWRLYKNGAGTSFYSWTPTEPIDVPPSQGFLLDVSISDGAMFPDANRYIQVRIYTDAALTDANAIILGITGTSTSHVFHGMKWSGAPLKTGRNTIRCAADYQYNVPATWGSKVYGVEFRISPANSVTLDVHGLYLEAPKKARAMVIADRGYKTFYDYAYPKLQAAGIPVTWAVDPGLFGTGTGENVAMTEAELDAAMASGNGDSCSFHAWQGQVTSTLTAEELVEDTARCIKWLQRKGYEGRMWRAAFTQGSAPEWAAIQHMVIGARNGDNRLGVARWVGQWPPIGWMHIPAMQLDNVTLGTTSSVIDSRFADMQKTHGMFAPFFHAIGSTQHNITPAQFDYWLAKSVQAMDEGWLEFGTFETFFAEIGGSFTSVNGATVATWVEPDGSVATKRLA